MDLDDSWRLILVYFKSDLEILMYIQGVQFLSQTLRLSRLSRVGIAGSNPAGDMDLCLL
jgi:hypothetical protein